MARRRVTMPSCSRLCSAVRIVVRLTLSIFDRSSSDGRRSFSNRPVRIASRMALRARSANGVFSSSVNMESIGGVTFVL